MSKRFADAIIDKLASTIGTDGGSYTEGTVNSAMGAVSSAISEYLMANTVITVSYKGVASSGTPDPVVQDRFKITGSCPPASSPTDFNDWIKQIEQGIMSGFVLAPKGSAGVMFKCRPFALPGIKTTQETLKSIHKVDDRSCQSVVWEEICKGIVEWISSNAKNIVPGPASRPNGSSTGTAQIISIKVT